MLRENKMRGWLEDVEDCAGARVKIHNMTMYGMMI